MAFGHFVLRVPHHGGAVDVGGYFPTEGVVQQIVLRRGGQVFAATNHMGDAHQVIVDDIGKIIGGQAVPLQQYLIVQRAVLHGDVAEHRVVECGRSLFWDALADNIRLTGGHAAEGLLQRKIAAGIVGTVKFAAVLLRGALFTEAVVRAALFHQQLRILSVGVAALGLNIRRYRPAHVRAFVVGQVTLRHGAVDHVCRTLHQTALVGILNAEDERAAAAAGNKPGIQRSAQIADVHIPGGRGGEPGADLSLGDARLHGIEVCFVSHKDDLRI